MFRLGSGSIVVALALVTAACGGRSESPTGAPSGTAPASATPAATAGEPEYQDPAELKVGDCFDAIADADDGALLAASMKDCAQEHILEVFGVEQLPDGATAPWPGQDEVDDASEELCLEAFESYVGIDYDQSRYDATYYTPTEETWAAGDRLVLCVADDGGDPVTGSIRGSNR